MVYKQRVKVRAGETEALPSVFLNSLLSVFTTTAPPSFWSILRMSGESATTKTGCYWCPCVRGTFTFCNTLDNCQAPSSFADTISCVSPSLAKAPSKSLSHSLSVLQIVPEKLVPYIDGHHIFTMYGDPVKLNTGSHLTVLKIRWFPLCVLPRQCGLFHCLTASFSKKWLNNQVFASVTVCPASWEEQTVTDAETGSQVSLEYTH